MIFFIAPERRANAMVCLERRRRASLLTPPLSMPASPTNSTRRRFLISEADALLMLANLRVRVENETHSIYSD